GRRTIRAEPPRSVAPHRTAAHMPHIGVGRSPSCIALWRPYRRGCRCSTAMGSTFWLLDSVDCLCRAQTFAGTTLTRGAQRLTGTVAGVAVGLALSAMISGWAALAVAVASAFFLLLAVLPMNYAWAIFFLSVGVVPFEAMLTGSVESQIGLFRIV